MEADKVRDGAAGERVSGAADADNGAGKKGVARLGMTMG